MEQYVFRMLRLYRNPGTPVFRTARRAYKQRGAGTELCRKTTLHDESSLFDTMRRTWRTEQIAREVPTNELPILLVTQVHEATLVVDYEISARITGLSRSDKVRPRYVDQSDCESLHYGGCVVSRVYHG